MTRLENLAEKIAAENLDAVIISKPENVHYFSGFRGDSTVLLIGKNFRRLITDSRYTEQAKQQTSAFELVEQSDGLIKKLQRDSK